MKFTFFWGGVFSQWYKAPFKVGDVEYNCAEQYMMAEKARTFFDIRCEQAIMATRDPRQQKWLGRQVKGFDETKWALRSRHVVYIANRAKFTQNPELLKELFATEGTILVEASPQDQIWGIGLGENDPKALDVKQWRGLNWLGQTLTDLREDLKHDPEYRSLID